MRSLVVACMVVSCAASASGGYIRFDDVENITDEGKWNLVKYAAQHIDDHPSCATLANIGSSTVGEIHILANECYSGLDYDVEQQTQQIADEARELRERENAFAVTVFALGVLALAAMVGLYNTPALIRATIKERQEYRAALAEITARKVREREEEEQRKVAAALALRAIDEANARHQQALVLRAREEEQRKVAALRTEKDQILYIAEQQDGSKNERLIAGWLIYHKIPHKREVAFAGLRGEGGKPLRYDFYLTDRNLLIEYDGKQHYVPSKFGSNVTEDQAQSDFAKRKRHDTKKNQYAAKIGIPVIRIPYTHESYDCTTKYLSAVVG